jgi:two-component system, cell cycle sensor histidine kinase and response regulator CckA
LKSEVGRGSVFELYFPALDAEYPDTEIVEKELPRYGHGETILFIDDELSILEICKAAIELHDYKVLTAPNGPDAVAIFANAEPGSINLVVTDINMPMMDGPATIKTLRHLDPDVKVLVASGILDEMPEDKLTELHIQGRLTKPFSAEKLINEIARVLNG